MGSAAASASGSANVVPAPRCSPAASSVSSEPRPKRARVRLQSSATSPTRHHTTQRSTNAAAELGDIDALVYTTRSPPLAKLTDVDSASWHRVFDTNVIGAAQITTAALPHLTATKGTAMYLSSVSASLTPPWPGLGAYVVSKAALDKLVEAWRVEEPSVNFTRCIVGDCGGGRESATGFADNWDWELLGELHAVPTERGLLRGTLIDPEHLVEAIDGVLRGGTTLAIPTVILSTRPPASQA